MILYDKYLDRLNIYETIFNITLWAVFSKVYHLNVVHKWYLVWNSGWNGSAESVSP